MKATYLSILAAPLIFLGTLGGVAGASERRAAVISGDHVLVGELVVTNASRNQFRLVGHSGSFTAPQGIAVDTLDGKPVQVELASNGRVEQIVEMPMRIDRITDGFEIISGQLMVRDAAARTFAVAGDDRIYVAPSGVDVQAYAGRMVKVGLDDQGRVIDINLAPLPPGASFPSSAPSVSTCSYNGYGYSDGWAVCQSGTQYRCENGTWRSLGVVCTAQNSGTCTVNDMSYWDGATRCEAGTQLICQSGRWRDLGTACGSGTTVSHWPRSCVVGDASVADGSSVCRRGTTFRCTDGQWVNAGAACS